MTFELINKWLKESFDDKLLDNSVILEPLHVDFDTKNELATEALQKK